MIYLQQVIRQTRRANNEDNYDSEMTDMDRVIWFCGFCGLLWFWLSVFEWALSQ